MSVSYSDDGDGHERSRRLEQLLLEGSNRRTRAYSPLV
jgi:hypothetical protein